MIKKEFILIGIKTFRGQFEKKKGELPRLTIEAAMTTLDMVEGFVKAMPEVDAVEVVHGQLIPSIAKVDCTCSVCRSEFDNILGKGLEKWNYCPNCGALVREKNEYVS